MGGHVAERTLHFLAVFTLSLGLGLYLTPLVRRGAISFGVLDHPDGKLKKQSNPIPYLGGMSVYLAFILSLAFVFQFREQLLGLLLGGTMMAMLGLFDDLRVLSPRLKLFGQLLAAVVLIRSDITIQIAFLPGWLCIVLTVLWLVGVTNALNILDVSDGLAGGVAALVGLGLFVNAVIEGDLLIGTTTLALVGALIGFLRYNQPPASIYLGDAGSLFIGFMVAALSMIGQYTRVTDLGVFAPLFFLVVPLLDTCLVVLARAARRQSPFLGSSDHLAHRLRARGWSDRRIALAAYALTVTGGSAALIAIRQGGTVTLALLGLGSAVFLCLLIGLLRQPPAPSSRSELAKAFQRTL